MYFFFDFIFQYLYKDILYNIKIKIYINCKIICIINNNNKENEIIYKRDSFQKPCNNIKFEYMFIYYILDIVAMPFNLGGQLQATS